MDNRYLEVEGEHRRLRFVRDEKCVRHGRRERYRDAGGKEPPTRLFLARPYSIEFDVERPDRGISRFIAAFTRPLPRQTSEILLIVSKRVSRRSPRINSILSLLKYEHTKIIKLT